MPRNGSGTYSLPAGNPVVTGTVISSTTQNNTLSDIATALTNSISNDGQTTPTADLPMGTFKHTGVGNATARTQYYTAAQAQDGSIIYVGTVGGTADVITLTPSPAITAYVAGQTFRFVASGANTTNVTVNVSSLGAVALTKNGSTALVAGDITSGAIVDITHDGTRFQLKNVSTSGSGSVVTTTGTQTLTNKTLTAPTTTNAVIHGTATGTGTLGGSIVVPLARMRRTEATGSSGVVSVTSSDTSVATADCGTVNNGDRILVSASLVMTKGGTGGLSFAYVGQSAGTATIETYSSDSVLNGNQFNVANAVQSIHAVSGIIKVTGTGTLTLALYGRSDGSNSSVSSSGAQIMAVVLNNG